ncbi:conjugal transfer protein [Leuconostoc citreum]|uniref:conjugal transfer protein n=1 Tax=Leuconostoc citreum TaxID=33964 RepID=UPI000BFEFBDC|nr:conjugal transfer protein [Leuconostoc citreum]
MRGLPKLKVNFEYERKKKEKAIKIPKAHVYNLGRVRKVVLIIVLGLFLYFSYVLFLANAIAQKNKVLRQNVTTLTKKLDEASAGTTSYNPIVGQYLGSFVTKYYTFDKNKSDDWLKEVTPYFANNVTLSNSTNTDNMKLTQAKLNGIFTVDSIKTAQYTLTIETNGKSNAVVVNIPYTQENDKLTVIGLPYVANEIDSVGQVGKARFDKTGKTLNDDTATSKIQKFTKQFVNKYVSSSTKDMSLFMSDPVGLDNAVDLVSLEDSDIKVTGSKEKPIVTAKITVKVHGTDIMQVQTIYLELKQQSSTYFVTKFLQA